MPALAARVRGRIAEQFGAPPEGLNYAEFEAWVAYFRHLDVHAEDARLQAEHDTVMDAAAAASRG